MSEAQSQSQSWASSLSPVHCFPWERHLTPEAIPRLKKKQSWLPADNRHELEGEIHFLASLLIDCGLSGTLKKLSVTIVPSL